jgi:hypothetical protein
VTEPQPADARLRAPRAAAIAGIVFSLLLIVGIVLMRMSVSLDLRDAGGWLGSRSGDRVALAMNLIPFAGIAFLWFVGVLRDRLGAREDRFFATVFLGSALLFLAMLFLSAALVGTLLLVQAADPARLAGTVIFRFARVAAWEILNVYAIKMAAVFIVVTSTLAWRTSFIPRWIAVTGFTVAVILVLSNGSSEWILLGFPAWVLLVSLYILVDNLGAAAPVPTT